MDTRYPSRPIGGRTSDGMSYETAGSFSANVGVSYNLDGYISMPGVVAPIIANVLRKQGSWLIAGSSRD